MFDEELSRQRLSLLGNPIEAIRKLIGFEMFRAPLEHNLLNTNKKNNAGAKPYDIVLLFNILLLQRYYGFGDHQVEYPIVDRTSFKALLGLSTGDNVPDEKTGRSLSARVTKTGLVEEVFEKCVRYLEKQELIINEEVLIDASLTVAPRQRNSREKTSTLERDKAISYGTTTPARKNIKTSMPVGQRKTGKLFMGIKPC